MLKLSQLQFNRLPFSILHRSIEICGTNYEYLMGHLTRLELSCDNFSLIEINNAWLKLNECALYCHDLRELRVEILTSNKLYCDYDVFIGDDYMGGKRISSISLEQMYIDINRHYLNNISDEKIDKFIKYNNRAEVLNNLL